MKKIKIYLNLLLIFIIISFLNQYTVKKELDFSYPVSCHTISSGFGYRFLGYRHFHNGIDFPVKIGTNIKAIEDGIVLFAKFNGAYGYTICVKHNEEFTSMYCHVNGQFIVSKGDMVKKNEIIAKVGPAKLPKDSKVFYIYNGVKSNGMTTGPHLHFSILKNGRYVDPLTIIK